MRGATQEATEVMMKSISEGTWRQYDKPIREWREYCRKEGISFCETSTAHVLKFFSGILENVKSFSTANTYRAVLSLISGNELGSNTTVSRFFKGLAKLKPKKYKYDVTWDPKEVLDELATWYPHEGLSLEALTKKLVTLLALITGQRIQTLTAIDIQNINLEKEPLRIKITEPIKTSGRSEFQPILEIPSFSEKPELCVASVLRTYITKTRALRPGNRDKGHLFITYKKPHHQASSQTISRWIRVTLEKSGIDTTIFSAQSTRHASTSAAARKGVNIEVIRRAAGWSSSSSVFARFYNRPIANTTTFASSILQ
ncbi:uncharacterized protein LOC127281422 [Leptopilina boulardi]|uniref:uncharacterized protein LOC127281422 n=1 Tax=Leptopilina boulardi TaxID=63433 RepID=UPI0021F51047|nr:uncharacterized protein LOC127281422 [Leptopilina boulardi]